MRDCRNKEITARICVIPSGGSNIWVLKELLITLSIDFKKMIELQNNHIDDLVLNECRDFAKLCVYRQQILCGRIARKILTIPGAISACVVIAPAIPEPGDERSEVKMTTSMLECMS